MEQQPGVDVALAEVEAALRALLLGPSTATATMGATGGSGSKPKEDAAAAAHRFLQVRSYECDGMGLAIVLRPCGSIQSFRTCPVVNKCHVPITSIIYTH